MEDSWCKVPEFIVSIPISIVFWIDFQLLQFIRLLSSEVRFFKFKALLISTFQNRSVHTKYHVKDDVPVIMPESDKWFLRMLNFVDTRLITTTQLSY